MSSSKDDSDTNVNTDGGGVDLDQCEEEEPMKRKHLNKLLHKLTGMASSVKSYQGQTTVLSGRLGDVEKRMDAWAKAGRGRGARGGGSSSTTTIKDEAQVEQDDEGDPMGTAIMRGRGNGRRGRGRGGRVLHKAARQPETTTAKKGESSTKKRKQQYSESSSDNDEQVPRKKTAKGAEELQKSNGGNNSGSEDTEKAKTTKVAAKTAEKGAEELQKSNGGNNSGSEDTEKAKTTKVAAKTAEKGAEELQKSNGGNNSGSEDTEKAKTTKVAAKTAEKGAEELQKSNGGNNSGSEDTEKAKTTKVAANVVSSSMPLPDMNACVEHTPEGRIVRRNCNGPGLFLTYDYPEGKDIYEFSAKNAQRMLKHAIAKAGFMDVAEATNANSVWKIVAKFASQVMAFETAGLQLPVMLTKDIVLEEDIPPDCDVLAVLDLQPEPIRSGLLQAYTMLIMNTQNTDEESKAIMVAALPTINEDVVKLRGGTKSLRSPVKKLT